MLKKLSEKLRAKFPATTPSCSMINIGHLEYSSLNIFNPKQAREKARPITAAKRKPKKKKRGGESISKVEKPYAWAKMS